MDEIKYDGLTIRQNGQSKETIFNIAEAMDQDNPRNAFLNGQLFVEILCDSILVQYFCKGSTGADNRRRTLFWNFIKSRYVDFFAKIKLLRTLEIINKSGITKLLDTKTYTSLKAIGAVRNAFHHNLDYDDALNCLTAGDKFVFISNQGKKLSTYKDVETLKINFQTEAYLLHNALNDLVHTLEDQKE